MVRKKESLLELRKRLKKKRPKFRRVESWRYKRVKDSWRKARGIDSKTRKKKKSAGIRMPTVGYRAPKKVRGLHPSGFEEVNISTQKDLEGLNRKKHAIKISSKLGTRKRIALVEYVQRRGYKILNLGVSQKELEELENILDSDIPEIEDEE